jgi:Glycosyl transferase family group 2
VQPKGYDYPTYSRLAGPLTEPGSQRGGNRVRYRSLLAGERHRIRAALLLAAAPVVSAVLLVWLVWPSHWTHRHYAPAWQVAADTAMLVSLGLIELFRLVNVASVAHATLVARDPVPVRPLPGTRVAFVTTFVPGKEPMETLRTTLAAAVRIRHDGPLDVWLLDEGDDAGVRALCAELGVHHFSRKGVARWNQPSGPFRARTKHGNYNAWLEAHGDAYEFFASVDTDHAPLPNYLERMLGYFRDPDVAFVVGPQVYGNYDSTVTKAAESQQFLFHALIQRAGNRYGSPMFVGTNNCVRISALKAVGGLYDSITEDMATGLEIHSHRNPRTGNRWRSVYTPDVLAVGEGPSTWTDFFTQQTRWSRGTYETLFRQFWRKPFALSPGRLANYALMLVYYPMTAVNWMLAAVSCALFLVLGASGIQVPYEVWLMLYSDAAALQIGLYLWNRRHNVSPHEPEGSSGTAGMVMSALCAPLYARSLTAAVLRRDSRFVVTPKGEAASRDHLATFRFHLTWLAVFVSFLLCALALGHVHVAMCLWAVVACAIAAGPAATWWVTERVRPAAVGGAAAVPAGGGQAIGATGTVTDGTVDGAAGAGAAGSDTPSPALAGTSQG